MLLIRLLPFRRRPPAPLPLATAAVALGGELHHRRSVALWAARDALHNLPFHLQLEHEADATFCHLVLSRLPEILDSAVAADAGFKLSPEQRTRLLGGHALSGTPLQLHDFDRADAGDLASALRIVKVMLWLDRRRFMRRSDWHTTIVAPQATAR